MYSCTQCEKRYASQNSLTRHVHIHRQTKKHACSVCRVVFYRRDLLSRHMRLHEPRPTAESTSTDVQTGADVGRKRCHTACVRCRELRTKCNGKRPCNSCSNAAQNCEYGRGSNRQSHLPAESESISQASGSPFSRAAESLDEVPHQQHEQYSEPACDSTSNAPTDTMMALDFQTCPRDIPDQQHAFPSQVDLMQPDALIQDADSRELRTECALYVTDGVSWPWLHESLFLPAPLDDFSMRMDPLGVQYGYHPLTLSGPSVPIQGESFQMQDNEVVTSSNSSWHLQQTHLGNVVGQVDHDSARIFEHSSNAPNSKSASQSGHAEGAVTATQSSPFSHIHAAANGFDRTNAHGTTGSQHLENLRNRRTRVVHDLVSCASTTESNTRLNGSRAAFWHKMSAAVADAFDLSDDPTYSNSPTLYRFCEVYIEHFAPLWPLLSPQNLDFNALQPLLFLVLTSIGSMYCGPSASKYGAMMHVQIRSSLAAAYEIDDGENDLLWLAQARLLTQVAALYFGQPKAFTYAQHLGVLLVAQARRMDLFSDVQAASFVRKISQMQGVASDQARFSIWMQLEARRRLAFGIFRADTYTSVLLHTKPLVSLEEIDLELPMCDTVWRGTRMAPELCMQIIEHDQTPGRELRASDIYRIALDQHEPLPPLDPFGHELLIFGLQYPIWRFSRDQKMFERLTGSEDRSAGTDKPATSPLSATILTGPESVEVLNNAFENRQQGNTGSEAHRLESSVRVMADLELERRRLMSALDKWEQALPLVKTFVKTKVDRSSLLSGLILYHAGYLSLYAPLRDLHQIQYRLADKRPIDPDLVHSVRQWANSRRGRLAAERSCCIWSMIAREAQVASEKRVNFNLLAFATLHHGAVILWSYGEAHDFTHENDTSGAPLVLEAAEVISIQHDESAKILNAFVELYDRISPARWSSFAQAASTLANHTFPLEDNE